MLRRSFGASIQTVNAADNAKRWRSPVTSRGGPTLPIDRQRIEHVLLNIEKVVLQDDIPTFGLPDLSVLGLGATEEGRQRTERDAAPATRNGSGASPHNQ